MRRRKSSAVRPESSRQPLMATLPSRRSAPTAIFSPYFCTAPASRTLVAHRGGAENDAAHARGEGPVYGLPCPAVRLRTRQKGRFGRNALYYAQVRRAAVARALQIDRVHLRCAPGLEIPRDGDGVIAVHGHLVVIALV